MRKNAEKMDLSSCNRLLWVPAGSHGFWAHDLLSNLSHDPDIDSQRVTILLAFTTQDNTNIEQLARQALTPYYSSEDSVQPSMRDSVQPSMGGSDSTVTPDFTEAQLP